jgi:predicted aconitase
MKGKTMYLTKEEERTCDGEYGWAGQICMKILVRLGDLFNATRLIPIESAHVSGVSYKTLGDAPIDFLEALAEAGAKTSVKAMLNPRSFDKKYLGKKIPKEFHKKQACILTQFEKMTFEPALTCTPYYLEKPERGAHLAWAESSAVVYTNSVLGAWTNREGGPSALAAGIIGKTPDYGMHKAENRQPNILVSVEKLLENEVEFGALGIHLGKILGDKIPMIQGLKNASTEELKQLGAALASSGMVNMFYLDVDTYKEKVEKISVETRDIKQTVENLSTAPKSTQPDLIYIGCPHCSFDEIKQIAENMGDGKVRSETEFWVCTSRYISQEAEEYVKQIEKSGGHVLTDTCAVVTWTELLGIRTIMTNSAKTAHYAPTLNKAETTLAPVKQCLKTAFKE